MGTKIPMAAGWAKPDLSCLLSRHGLQKAMVSEKEVEKIAKLARLQLSDAEKQAFAQQLSSVLNHFQQLASVSTDGVEPLVTPTDIVERWRADEVKTWKGAEAAVREAPEKVGNLFKVPPVVGG